MSPNQEYLELNYVAQTATGLGNNNKIIMANHKIFSRMTGCLEISRLGKNFQKFFPQFFPEGKFLGYN